MKNFCRLNNFWLLFSLIALFVGNSQLHIKLSLFYSFITVVCCRWSVPPSMEKVVVDSASMQRALTSPMRSPTVSWLDQDPVAGSEPTELSRPAALPQFSWESTDQILCSSNSKRKLGQILSKRGKMIYLMILRQNHWINYKLNATSIVLPAGPTPRGLQGQGPRRPLHEWQTVKSASDSLECFLVTAGDRLALYSLSLYTLKLFFIIQVSVTRTLVIIYDKCMHVNCEMFILNTSKICIVLFSA